MPPCATHPHPKTARREEKSDKKKEERIGAQLVAEMMGPPTDTATFAISDPIWRPSELTSTTDVGVAAAQLRWSRWSRARVRPRSRSFGPLAIDGMGREARRHQSHECWGRPSDSQDTLAGRACARFVGPTLVCEECDVGQRRRMGAGHGTRRGGRRR